MSLANPNEELDDLITPKKSKLGNLTKKFSKIRMFAIILIIGVIIGILIGHYYIEPLITQESAVCKNCILTNQLLTKENQCLYSILPNSQEAILNCVDK